MGKGFKIILFFVLLTGYVVKGQESRGTDKDDKYRIAVSSNNNLIIVFENKTTIDQLLVIVYDDRGETIFMDSQYDFEGDYSRSIDLSKGTSTVYSLKIIYNEEKIDKVIKIKR
jgi:hypothetical protein